MPPLLFQAPLAGFLAYFLVLVAEASLLRRLGLPLQSGTLFIFLPAFIEEFFKIGLTKKVFGAGGSQILTIILLCLTFGIVENFFSQEKTLWGFFRLPIAHIFFSLSGFLLAGLLIRRQDKTEKLSFFFLWLVLSSLLHGAFNLIILNFHQPF